MKKPEGEAKHGWYDDPEILGNERYWNGKFWENQTRKIGEVTEDPIPYGEFKLGLFWFRYPLSRDKLFTAYLIVLGLSFISFIYGEVQAGYASTGVMIVTTLLSTPLAAVYIYILFAPFLYFRRRKDKKGRIANAPVAPLSKGKVIKATLGGLFGLLAAIFILGLINSSDNEQVSNSKFETFREKQELISEILKEYNADAAVAVGVVRDVSDGAISTGDAIAKFTRASGAITTHLSNLRETCLSIDFPTLSGEGEVLAFAKLMNVLRAGCEITPKQFLILQDIFRSQIDEDSSQNELDQLSAELDALNQQKINITIEGLEAALPYLNENEAIYVRQLLEGLRKD
jgi:hypothetical protein